MAIQEQVEAAAIELYESRLRQIDDFALEQLEQGVSPATHTLAQFPTTEEQAGDFVKLETLVVMIPNSVMNGDGIGTREEVAALYPSRMISVAFRGQKPSMPQLQSRY